MAMIWLGCPTETTTDDDSAPTDDDDDVMEPGGQIDAPTALEFGEVDVGESTELTVEIRNTGVQPLLISAVLLVGSSEDFSVVFDEEISLEADANVYLPLDVTFTPTTAEAQEASLILLTSAINVDPTDPWTVLVSGNGIQDADGDGAPWGEDYEAVDADCDDSDAGIHPGAEELCDGVDNDCDGVADNRPDGDGDGATLCDEYPDCDDADGTVHPAWVDPNGTGGPGTEDEPFALLSDAIESEHCGVVLMREGIYHEGQAIEIGSGPVELISVDGHLAAEVNGGGLHPLFSVAGDEVTFVDVMFQDGFAESTAGGVHAAGTVGFEGCTFMYNRSNSGAGAVLVEEAELTVEGCQFLMNSGSEGGGIATWGSGGVDAELVTIGATDFVGNNGLYGGGIYTTDVELHMEDVRFILNDAMYGAGGMILESAEVSLDGCSFQGNTGPAEGDGGAAGLGVMGVDEMSVVASLFDQNEALYAAGVYAEDSTVRFTDTTFRNNRSGTAGGALAAAIAMFDLDGCALSHNEAVSTGGAIDLGPGSYAFVDQSSFLGNRAEDGGAVNVRDSTAEFTNVVFDANEGNGAAVYHDGGPVLLDHVTAFDNRGAGDSGAIVVEQTPAEVTITNSIFAENAQYALVCEGEGLSIDYSDVYSSSGDLFSTGCVAEMANNILEEPMFSLSAANLDPLDDDLSLQLLSPCVDAGDPAFTDTDGTRADMGAYGGDGGDW